MRAAGVVMFDLRIRIAARRRHDIAFGDDFDPVAQLGCECGAKDLFGLVTAIDIRLIHGRDALIETRTDLVADVVHTGVGIIAQAPHAIDKAAQVEGFVQLDTIH